ncbi:SIS domain-containing protein [Herbiconiux sp. CPCC 205716]|uniref:Glutamine--fructose-6-phosphate aminotransferase [isomerizing] n=1 Tax=Herbiconiux gentiana TaxID=2970912 RepID=A0ABT2GBM3_9MICO|nr:SIS domain-containing protein [Herbiconiux gentiana]MCS5713543.1 SIS domain-containing protein [Herbiconiux gentiana]
MDYLPFSVAIRRQPAELRSALTSIRSSLQGATIDPWRPGDTVAVLAMGASTASAFTLTAALTRAGVRSVNLTPTDLAAAPADFEPGDHYVVVTESGRSPEPIAAAAAVTPGRRVGITNYPAQAVSGAVDHVVDLGGFDDSAVYSIGYISTLLAYSELLGAVGLGEQSADADAVPALVERMLAVAFEAAPALAAHLSGVSSIDVVGSGFSYATAVEASLMFREALAIPAASFEGYQYLHGPAEPAGETTAVIVFGDSRELVLAADLARAGAPVIVVSGASDAALAEVRASGARVVRLPADLPGFARAIAEIVVVQAIVEATGARMGTSTETFNYSQPDTKVAEV